MSPTNEFVAAAFALLLVGSVLAARGGAGLSYRMGFPAIVIALLVVPLALAAPEFAVALHANLNGQPAFAVGAIVGSNILNILFVFSLAALVKPLPTAPRVAFRDGLVFVLASCAFYAVARDGIITSSEGIWMLAALALSVALTLAMDLRRPDLFSDEGSYIFAGRQQRHAFAFWLLVLGAISVFAGAATLISGATLLAKTFGYPQESAALSIGALGVGLPELFFAMIAVARGRYTSAVSSVLGANTINILGVIGLSATLRPIVVAPSFVLQDLPIMAASAVLIVPLLNADWKLSRPKGALLLAFYAAYLAFLGLRLGLIPTTVVAFN